MQLLYECFQLGSRSFSNYLYGTGVSAIVRVTREASFVTRLLHEITKEHALNTTPDQGVKSVIGIHADSVSDLRRVSIVMNPKTSPCVEPLPCMPKKAKPIIVSVGGGGDK